MSQHDILLKSATLHISLLQVYKATEKMDTNVSSLMTDPTSDHS